MEGPYIRIEETGTVVPLSGEVTTVGRGNGVDVRLADPSVSRLHAEIVRRGPYAYVADLGLSRNGTRVNGRLVARRILEDGDVLSFGAARCRVGGIPREDLAAEVELRRSASPELTRREQDVLTALCRPALSDEAFVAPATAREIAADLVVTEAAVKQHLLRLYQKFRVPEGPNRRVRLANEVIALGLVRPLPPADRAEPPSPRTLPDRTEPPPPRIPTDRAEPPSPRTPTDLAEPPSPRTPTDRGEPLVPQAQQPSSQSERARPAQMPTDGLATDADGGVAVALAPRGRPTARAAAAATAGRPSSARPAKGTISPS